MTIEEMIAERTVKVSAALGNANDAISLKGGIPSADLHGLAAAIATIPAGAGGAYNVQTTDNEDGSQNLNITDAGGGLPSGIAEMSRGTFTAATDAPNTNLTIPHGLSAAPNLFHITRKDNKGSGNGANYILGALYDARGNTTMAARFISNASGAFTNTGLNFAGSYSGADTTNISVYYYGGYGIKAGDYDWVAIRFEEA